ncbi:hypothetical protein BS636_00710 [Acinetobacter sp. LoGeW2-3]|uniref:hypothetical protein n=1 Tax=Acinetobacter sp. LoGeW2-3 TaxID=1808001 RepID=UPI000C059A3B|nr:hypothetical protein [Acinetobacter sp. LoGeW2-3]ATO18298.1 hypothetical protein BS636_00710 [Acinetobacter sp. LoGeW2-3]
MAQELFFLTYPVVSNDNVSSVNFIKDFILPLVPSLITIIGWYVIANLERSKIRDNRQEVKELKAKDLFERRLFQILEKIDDLHLLSKEYYKHSGSDPFVLEYDHVIPIKFKQLNHLINRAFCPESVSSLTPVLTKAYIDFKRVITGGDFASKRREVYKLDHSKYSDISKYYMNLYLEIEKFLP